MGIIERFFGSEKMKPTSEKYGQNLPWLLEVHCQYVHRIGCNLSERKLLADQAQSEAAFALAQFSLDAVASPLIIKELPLLLGHQIWITFGPTKVRTTQVDLMTCTERTITACLIN